MRPPGEARFTCGWTLSPTGFMMSAIGTEQMPPEPKIVDVEVVNEPPRASEREVTNRSKRGNGASEGGAPIHALSALILVAVDSLWAIFDWLPPVWPFAIPLCFLGVFLPTLIIQKQLMKDSNGRALAYALVLGTLAAIPTPISGTPIGIGLLAWTGLGKVLGRLGNR